MKALIGLIFLVALAQTDLNFAQPNQITAARVSLQLHDAPLRQALDEIAKQSNVSIIYSDAIIDGIRVSCNCNDWTIAAAFNYLLKNTKLDYLVTPNGQIVLLNKRRATQHKGVLRGFVKDQANGETLSFVSVVLEGTGFGAASDENGYFVISGIPAGPYVAQARLIGYETAQQAITIAGGKTVTLNFQLEQLALDLDEVVVTADRERFERQVEPSTLQLSPREIASTPAFVEADLFRALQTLPGVTTRTDFSGALYIRGGNPSENIILLDDVRIYNPYHVGGVFSSFNTDAIKSVDISVGGFPPRYGNAVSGVIAITNKDGNSKEFAAKGSVSLVSSKLTLEHPIPKGSLMLSARRTYFDFFYTNLSRLVNGKKSRFPYFFYDFYGKLNFALASNSKLTLSGFFGDDVLHLEKDNSVYDPEPWHLNTKEITDVRLGNRASALKWQHIFSPKLFTEFVVSTSLFRSRAVATAIDPVQGLDEIRDVTAKTDMTYFLSDRHELKFGADYQKLSFRLFLNVAGFNWIGAPNDQTRQANFYSAYLQDNWTLSERLNIESGARLTYYHLGQYWRVDPRLSARYRLDENLNLKGAFGLFHQYFYTFNPEDLDYVRFVDLWFPIDQRFRPIRVKHYIAGLEHRIGEVYQLAVEGYYKDYDHVLDLNEFGREDVAFDDFLSGWGKAAGLEFLLRKQQGRLTGLLGYSLAFTERTIARPRPSNELSEKDLITAYETFPSGHDRRHSLTLVANYQPNRLWDWSARFTFNSGLPDTPRLGWRNCYRDISPAGYSEFGSCPVKAKRNSGRLPAYLRLDVSIARTYDHKSWSMQPFLQIVNLTNYHNIFFYEYDTVFDYNGPEAPIRTYGQRRGLSMFPFLPTFGVNFQF